MNTRDVFKCNVSKGLYIVLLEADYVRKFIPIGRDKKSSAFLFILRLYGTFLAGTKFEN